MPSTLFHIPDEALFEPLSSSPGNNNSFGDNKTSIYKTIWVTKELLLISLTQLLEATAELVFFSHKFNPKLNIIALADVALGQVRQEANKICPIYSKQFYLTGSCYLCVPSPDRFKARQYPVRLCARVSGPNCNCPGSPYCNLYQQQTD